MNQVDYKIIYAGPEWLDRWIAFCQEVYSVYYVRPEHGITKKMFSKDIFAKSGFEGYVKEHFANNPDRGAWLALGAEEEIIGSLCVHNHNGYCELKGFYVSPDKKGQGIGRALYEKAVVFAGDLPMKLDVVHDMDQTIAMYERWGFRVDETRGYILYPWKDWTESARYANRGIYMVKDS